MNLFCFFHAMEAFEGKPEEDGGVGAGETARVLAHWGLMGFLLPPVITPSAYSPAAHVSLGFQGRKPRYNVHTGASASGYHSSTDTEIYGLNVADSVPDNLAADLADAASEMNVATYSGYSLTASTTDPTGVLGAGYNYFIKITNPTLGTGSPNFGFDFTQLNGTSDVLTVSGIAAVPEPTVLSLMTMGSLIVLSPRRSSSVAVRQSI